MTLYARLDRTGQRVQCALQHNPSDIAHVWQTKSGERYLYVPMGWLPRPQDGVWAPTRHAAAVTQAGHQSKFHRTHWRFRAEPRLAGRLITQLPASVKCPHPKCGSVQTLDPEHLRLSPIDDDLLRAQMYDPNDPVIHLHDEDDYGFYVALVVPPRANGETDLEIVRRLYRQAGRPVEDQRN